MTVDDLIAEWRRREETYTAQGLTNMADTARRYRESLERLRDIVTSP